METEVGHCRLQWRLERICVQPAPFEVRQSRESWCLIRVKCQQMVFIEVQSISFIFCWETQIRYMDQEVLHCMVLRLWVFIP